MAEENNNNNNNNDPDNNNNSSNHTDAVVVTVTEEKSAHDTKEEQKAVNTKLEEEENQPRKSIRTTIIVHVVALITFLLSIPLLVYAVWLLYTRQLDCEGLLKNLPKLQIGVAVGLICTFFISNAVVYFRPRFTALGLIVVKIALVVLLVVGLSLDGSFNVDPRGLAASPNWLKTKVQDDVDWNNIKTCLFDTRICMDLISRSYNLKTYDMDTSKMSPIESGCCSPPSACEMEYVNKTHWRKTKRGTKMDLPYDRDCDLWDNQVTMLCYDCRACKHGFVKTLEAKWLKLGTFLVVMSLLLMISHLLLFVATMWEQYQG